MYHLLFPFLGGLGAINWKDEHNVRHHGHPNIVGVDDDMELWPLAHIREAHLRAGRVRRFVQRHFQAWLWWPMTSLFTWSIKVDNVRAMVRHARRHGVGRAWLLDLGAQLLHYVAWLVVPSLVWGFLPVFGFYLALFGLVSVMLALVFTTGHMGLPIRHDHADPVELQLETTRNLILPAWLSFFVIGLDYQIEHHLFPKIPHRRLRVAAPIVRRWAQARSLPYRRVRYATAIAEVTRYVGRAWDVPAVPALAPTP
jgi:fatty acid desaturase